MLCDTWGPKAWKKVEAVIDQRKRKGILEYLVQWKESGSSGKDKSWEPASKIAADCANAVADYIKSKTRKRSQSKTRKSSRSRSRSTSRGRKTKPEKVVVRRSTRSSSRGRSSKIPVSEKKVVSGQNDLNKSEVEVNSSVEGKSIEEKTKIILQKPVEEEQFVVSTSSTTTVSTSVVSSSSSSENMTMSEKNKTSVSPESPQRRSSRLLKHLESEETLGPTSAGTDRVLRSATQKKEELEVQRVHTELRPVHKDDGKPRSSVWKVADYLVIALFVLSVIAAIFLFVEKFVDLKDFKPNLSTLKTRLAAPLQGVHGIFRTVCDQANGVWLRLMDLVGSGAAKK